MTNKEIIELIEKTEISLANIFKQEEDIALYNQNKVLSAFRDHQIAIRHFAQTEGYGYDDIGRDSLCRLYAQIFGTESAIVTPNIASGTHALTLALFGILRPGDTLFSVCNDPYDTLHETICGKNNGSLMDFGINYEKISMINDKVNYDDLKSYLSNKHPKVIYVQRSKGYELREALTLEEIKNICSIAKSLSPNSIIMVDNCYGEFVDKEEPTDIGADLCVGSLIKNIGGGLAPTGGYIVGKEKYITLISYRLTSPSIGMEVGSYLSGYRLFYQGLFMAPHIVLQAKKSAMLFSAVFEKLGYEIYPKAHTHPHDIICSIKFGNKEKLIEFCQKIQYCSPIDSNVLPLPWNMPGYNDEVIMAAGCFVSGASIELSCDSPIREPYVAYLQGALTYEHAKIALIEILKNY